ncbi:uncharacterized protein LOC9631116 [Selaginella moellendorffii]|uniref:uncharacterized protein LOC9631116 n=1 Tax=Selaginella moellendorffii TaxID=88036 RepID=UPI000D1CFCA8|nr:uncharacterized protein LOC9631116 [Selaginella moellendorffii]|eukprot:XP_002967768.2 uncharacterized protein LOC9631116 [Selaginella moellendorffii]
MTTMQHTPTHIHSLTSLYNPAFVLDWVAIGMHLGWSPLSAFALYNLENKTLFPWKEVEAFAGVVCTTGSPGNRFQQMIVQIRAGKLRQLVLDRKWNLASMKNSSSWIIGALLLVSLAKATSVEPGFTVKTLFDLGKHSANAFALYPDPRNKFVLALDSSGNRIWKLRLPLSQNSSLEAFAGSFVGESGYVDGPAAKSLFNRPQSLAICDNGAVFVADTRNLAIRKISKDGEVTTIAGGSSRKPGFADGPGDTARFSSEFSLACSCGSLLIADRGNRLIREIQIDDPKSCDSSDSAVSGSQKWALIPVVLLGVCLGMPLGAFIIWKILDQRCRQAISWETLKDCWRAFRRTMICKFGSRSELASAVFSLFLLVCHQAQLLASVFFGVAHEVKTKPTAPVKQDQDLHSLLGNTKDEPPDLIDFMDLESSVAPSRPLSFPDLRNLTMELECLEKFQQEFKDKRKHS